MKKILSYIALSAIAMSGCGGDTEEIASVGSNYKLYSNSEIEISVPIDWDIIESGNFTSNVPSNTTVAFLSNEKNERFTSNVNITKSTNQENTSLNDFSKSSMLNAKKKLLEFKQLSFEEESINNTEAITYVFSGKQRAKEPILDFQQTFMKNEDTFYTITFAHLPSETKANIDKVNTGINTITIL